MYKLINPNLINSRVDEWGSKEMVIEIITMLKGEYNDKIVSIEKAVTSRDFKGIKELVHSIKSNLYFFLDRTSEFGVKIQELENKGRDSDSSNMDQLFEYFKTNCETTLNELDQFVAVF